MLCEWYEYMTFDIIIYKVFYREVLYIFMKKGKKKTGLIVGTIVFGVLTLGSIGYYNYITSEKVSQRMGEAKIRGLEEGAVQDETYKVIDIRDTSYSGIKQSDITILVEEEINKEELEKILKKAAKEELKRDGYDNVWVYAYGDKRFFDNGTVYTHGSLKLDKSGVFSEERYKVKSEVPTNKEKEIYLEWYKYIDQDKLEKEATQSIMKKYNLSEKELDNIFLKMSNYIDY